MKHLKLFEEFNPLTGKQFADKIRIYAEASDVAKKVTHITVEKTAFVFTIETDIPSDFEPNGTKSFKVVIPTSIKDSPYVETYEDGKLVLNTTIEPDGAVDHDNIDINSMVLNFIEATGLYDDTVAQAIATAYQRIKSTQDIKQVLLNLN